MNIHMRRAMRFTGKYEPELEDDAPVPARGADLRSAKQIAPSAAGFDHARCGAHAVGGAGYVWAVCRRCTESDDALNILGCVADGNEERYAGTGRRVFPGGRGIAELYGDGRPSRRQNWRNLGGHGRAEDADNGRGHWRRDESVHWWYYCVWDEAELSAAVGIRVRPIGGPGPVRV
ncbi:hypothetical protein HYPSUDRAFT_57818 [Hypholoma sublateritium FD-334 SS-4]|uniref:Uncharacterized protein n=1 Tax=Hypholoma sublateritium (strain FD-334 SS-4) TaxID=945553 RepID=A0A0D2KRN1_HYPSF|nr:hypothetical protein HYPSUDRAFT_57818 [Hypholoma sublateritium FD-334 SS-4]